MQHLSEERRAALAETVELVPDPKRPMGFEVQRTQRSRFSDSLLLRLALQDTPTRSSNTEVRILAEGDSWCNLLWPISGYPKTLVNVLAERFYTVNLGWPGDTFEDILREQQDVYRQPLQSNTFDFLIFSAGGVDFFTALAKNVKAYGEVGGSERPGDYIDSEFDRFLSRVKKWHKGVAKQVEVWTTRTVLLLHGYDYAEPQPAGRFLGRRFEELGYNIGGGMPQKIVREAVNRYYAVLAEVAEDAGPRVRVVDCRGVVNGHWHDELHATTAGARLLADRFLEKMEQATPSIEALVADIRAGTATMVRPG